VKVDAVSLPVHPNKIVPGSLQLQIPIDDLNLGATLLMPSNARGLVVLLAVSDNDPVRPHHRALAAALKDAGFGTLTLGLLTPTEQMTEQRSG
jgi:hypothetical protein